MKDEYDFTGAEQGKLYRPLDELDMPIYLDKEVKEFFKKNSKTKVHNTLLVKSLIRF